LDVHLWYPAEAAGTETEKAEYEGLLPFSPGRKPAEAPDRFRFRGIAVEGAAPVAGQLYPLVVVSHGYGNWAAHLSYLTENLASKGYVVASIDHRELAADSPAGFALSFADVVFQRAQDQRFVVQALAEFASTSDPVGRIVDAESVGLVGYSMGGFGALATAGAEYDLSSPLFQRLPGPLREGLRDSQTPLDPRVKAIVAIAPWGGSLPSRAWTEESLAAIEVPLLFIAGDQDDVSGFDGGIEWLFESAAKSQRWMLVYQNARHNVGGNPAPPEASEYFDLLDWFNEAVWRPERVNAINQHFITALMDWRLKGEEDKRSYLDVSPAAAADGAWPNGSRADAAYSSGEHDGQPYWKGFHRRFALGLEMRRLSPVER
jgi:predicted dienelactone hydrolase